MWRLGQIDRSLQRISRIEAWTGGCLVGESESAEGIVKVPAEKTALPLFTPSLSFLGVSFYSLCFSLVLVLVASFLPFFPIFNNIQIIFLSS